MTRLIAALVMAGTMGVGLAAAASAEPVALVDKPGHVTEGTVTVDAPPAEVYRLVTMYARWPAILSDVTSVEVEGGGARDARVRFRSRAIGREITTVFDNVPDRVIRFRLVKGPPGGRAHGEYQLQPIDGGRRTRIVADLYLDVVGLPGAFVSDAETRAMRHNKLASDLGDVQRAFAARGTSPTAAP